MVVVYLKNGEKAPMPDASFVKLEAGAAGEGTLLRCYFGDREVGVFKWDEVAGYTVAVPSAEEVSPAAAYEAWERRLNP
jgi:hypothetical protein